MKERPILFSAPMVRALLDGRKTQTRRAIRGPEKCSNIRDCAFCCPYGHQRGDRLWCRETFFPVYLVADEPRFAAVTSRFLYRADWDYRHKDRSIIGAHHWKPSIFCTRWASRITLEITDVRVQRLQEISEEDAKAEGVMMPDDSGEPGDIHAEPPPFWSYVKEFEHLWESINGPGSWDKNPWIWAISFRRIKP